MSEAEVEPALPPAVAASAAYLLDRAAARLRAASDAALAPLDLPARPALMLLTLAERPLPQSALGRLHGVDRTTMVAVVDDLVERGLVDRLADPVDRRAYALTLTKAGRSVARTAAARLGRAERDALVGLSDRQREQLLAGLRALVGPSAPS